MNDGLCKCGCRRKTIPAARNRADRGWVKGQPVPYIRGHNSEIPLLQRIFNFWRQVRPVPESGWPDCIEWSGFISKGGYGVFSSGILGERQAHRISYILTFGPFPLGLEPDHLCRNRKCINPYHLEAVTRKVNSRRGARAKLTDALASEIRVSVEPTRILVERYGVSRATIKSVRAGRSWS